MGCEFHSYGLSVPLNLRSILTLNYSGTTFLNVEKITRKVHRLIERSLNFIVVVGAQRVLIRLLLLVFRDLLQQWCHWVGGCHGVLYWDHLLGILRCRTTYLLVRKPTIFAFGALSLFCASWEHVRIIPIETFLGLLRRSLGWEFELCKRNLGLTRVHRLKVILLSMSLLHLYQLLSHFLTFIQDDLLFKRHVFILGFFIPLVFSWEFKLIILFLNHVRVNMTPGALVSTLT